MQMYRIQMDHLPFWHFPPTAAGEGIGQGTYDIIQVHLLVDQFFFFFFFFFG